MKHDSLPVTIIGAGPITGFDKVRTQGRDAHPFDMEAAARVELQLPHTGVCSTRPIDGATLAVASASSCCADDAEAKEAEEAGCGCPSTPQPQPVTVRNCP